eukprot:TRINITY_DN2931_c0_g1_i3.p1 TRINITY_DN2931_c0_g1~~TRINITY_DN2931_c0_g1_i3.p1  ORF type:complete len:748 (-),score=118.62 TRINITY_DN2931_c0_g1_i3:369-2612(-)
MAKLAVWSVSVGLLAREGLALEDDLQAVLDAHNVYRCMHNVPRFTWDEDIEARAQEWAKKGIFEHSSDEFRIINDEECGENLAWGYPERTGTDSTKAWYDEIKYTEPYGIAKSFEDSHPAGEMIGHYTQLVWKGSTRLGCAKGKARDEGNQGDLWVCQYCKAGNYVGKYAANILAPTKSYEACYTEIHADAAAKNDKAETDPPTTKPMPMKPKPGTELPAKNKAEEDEEDDEEEEDDYYEEETDSPIAKPMAMKPKPGTETPAMKNNKAETDTPTAKSTPKKPTTTPKPGKYPPATKNNKAEAYPPTTMKPKPGSYPPATKDSKAETYSPTTTPYKPGTYPPATKNRKAETYPPTTTTYKPDTYPPAAKQDKAETYPPARTTYKPDTYPLAAETYKPDTYRPPTATYKPDTYPLATETYKPDTYRPPAATYKPDTYPMATETYKPDTYPTTASYKPAPYPAPGSYTPPKETYKPAPYPATKYPTEPPATSYAPAQPAPRDAYHSPTPYPAAQRPRKTPYYTAAPSPTYYPSVRVPHPVKRDAPASTVILKKTECFPGESLVQSSLLGRVPLKTLPGNARVLVRSASGDLMFQQLQGFAHIVSSDTHSPSRFFVVEHRHGEIRATANHIIFTVGRSGLADKTMADVKIGDHVLSVGQYREEPVEVLAVREDVTNGQLVAPLLRSGTIVVDGVSASNYAGSSAVDFPHSTMHAAFYLQRCLVHWLRAPKDGRTLPELLRLPFIGSFVKK